MHDKITTLYNKAPNVAHVSRVAYSLRLKATVLCFLLEVKSLTDAMQAILHGL
jgi:hypothetical protein